VASAGRRVATRSDAQAVWNGASVFGPACPSQKRQRVVLSRCEIIRLAGRLAGDRRSGRRSNILRRIGIIAPFLMGRFLGGNDSQKEVCRQSQLANAQRSNESAGGMMST
jgi:hypothetical protein